MRQVSAKSTPKTGGLYEVNVFDHMNAKVDALYQKIDSLSIVPFTLVTYALVAFVGPLLSSVIYAELMSIPIEIVK